MSTPETEAISLVEETAEVTKHEVTSGRVRVQTAVDVVEELVRATLEESQVEVRRVPIDRFVDTVPVTRTEGDVVIVPIFEEVLVVEKRLLLKEELHLQRTIVTETVEVPVSVRKQRAIIERIDVGEDHQS